MAFVSELDQFLVAFDQKYPEKSSSQLTSIKKYKRIFQLRDNASSSEDKEKQKINQFLKN